MSGLRVGDATVAAAASGGCLRTLLCGACVWVTDDSMRTLASVRHHPPSRKRQRSSLGIACLRLHLADMGAERTSSRMQCCPGLQVVSVAGCSRVTDVGVAALAAGCVNLRELDLSYNGRLSDAAVDSLAGAVCFPIAVCPRLSQAILSCRLRGYGGTLDTGLEQLEFLGLDFCGGVALPAATRLAAGCSPLRRLSICGMVQRATRGILCDMAARTSTSLQAVRLIETWSCECAPDKECRAASLCRHTLWDRRRCQIHIPPFDELCDALEDEEQEIMLNPASQGR